MQRMTVAAKGNGPSNTEVGHWMKIEFGNDAQRRQRIYLQSSGRQVDKQADGICEMDR